MDSSEPAEPPSIANFAWLVPAWIVGAGVRLWGLRDQVLIGDETHALAVALKTPLAKILTTYRLADPCIPLTALYRLLGEAGVGLSEAVVRTPSVVAGLLALILFPLLLQKWVGGRTGRTWAVVLAWLLAISPGLIYYSRIARPYAIVVVLAPVAAAAFWRWWCYGGRGWAALFVASGAASCWFHLATVPFVAAPLAFGTADLVVGSRIAAGKHRRSLFALAGVATAWAAGVAAFLVPAWRSLWRLVRIKADGATLDLSGLWEVARLEAGAGAALTIVFWLAAVVGMVLMARRYRRVTLFAACVVAAQWVGIAVVLRPSGIGHAVVVHRYVLATLPVVLLAVSGALALLWEWGRPRRGPAGLLAASAVAVLVILLAVTGPYASDPRLRLGPFAGTTVAASFVRPAPDLPPEAVPRVYTLLGDEPGDGAIIEAPSHFGSFTQAPAAAFARVHERPVVLAVANSWVADPRLALRTAVLDSPAAMLATDARFLVVLLDRPRFDRLTEDPDGAAAHLQSSKRNGRVARARRLDHELRRAWGPPHLVDSDARVWDLARVRASTARNPERGAAGRLPDRGEVPRPRR